MKNNMINDFAEGFFNTLIKAPFQFGMFIGNISGLAGKEQQEKAQLKYNLAKKTLSTIYEILVYNECGCRETLLTEVGSMFLNNAKERPAYFMGSLATGFIGGIGKYESIIEKLAIKTNKFIITPTGKGDMAFQDLQNIINEKSKDIKIDLDINKNESHFVNNLNDIDKKTKIYFHSQTNTKLYDPLVLDLNNNGRIDTITLYNSKAFFDHNNDNIAYKSSWISKDDGLLVLDKNNNNLIDNGNELFGNFTEISSNSYALNGFEALKLLDSNEDGVIDINNKEFNNLKVWLYEDGITQSKSA